MKKHDHSKSTLPDGTAVELYLENDLIHRDGAPALRVVTSNGVVIEMYLYNGRLSRADGPAKSIRHPNGAGVTQQSNPA